ncbi:lipocalin-like domain-containing protein [Capnocytophaga gingivalis]|uniref:lipocalin family protein n=1 Tax=Capnocytophaga gingivalis TaxID=1017 RepID=UPI002B47D15E|nr:lipocalin family protein [Capnocytophaga gingivalis]MEB3014126.1 lipocalin family protein [Capnocytophaga gingivalis]
MKRILLAAMASIALLISSCGKSDDSSGDITGIWQKESETVNGQSQTINDCEKKSAIAFTQNQITFHDFSDRPGFCRYTKQLHTYKIEGNAIKSNEDSSINLPFSISGNTLTIEFVENAKKFVFKYKKISQAELDAILATVNNNNGGGNNNAQNLEGIWQKESETINGQSQTIDDCEKKSAVVFTQNQLTFHDFIENAGACRYSKQVHTYKIEGNAIKNNEDSSINLPFSVSGNTLTVESVRGQEKTIIKYRKITQAQLDAILATVNNGGN